MDDENRKQALIKAEIAEIERLIQKGSHSDVASVYGIYAGYNAEERIAPFHFMQPFTHESYRQTLNGSAFFHYAAWLQDFLLPDKNIKSPLESIFIKAEYYKACLDILSDYTFTELGQKNGAGVFFGIADAFKTYSRLLKPTPQGTWSDEMLVKAFNSHFQTNFGGKKREIKRGGLLQKGVKAEVEARLSKL